MSPLASKAFQEAARLRHEQDQRVGLEHSDAEQQVYREREAEYGPRSEVEPEERVVEQAA